MYTTECILDIEDTQGAQKATKLHEVVLCKDM